MNQRSVFKKFVVAAGAVAFIAVTIWSAKTMALPSRPPVGGQTSNCRTPPC